MDLPFDYLARFLPRRATTTTMAWWTQTTMWFGARRWGIASFHLRGLTATATGSSTRATIACGDRSLGDRRAVVRRYRRFRKLQRCSCLSWAPRECWWVVGGISVARGRLVLV